MTLTGHKRAASASPIEGQPESKKARSAEHIGFSDIHVANEHGPSGSASTPIAAPVPMAPPATTIDPAFIFEDDSDLSSCEENKIPIDAFFHPWTPPAHLTTVPSTIENSWGIRPCPPIGANGDREAPKSRPNSPSARSSNAQTNPPLWEDRKFPFVSGRYQTSFGPIKQAADPTAPLLDQEDNLVLRLIDMRPIRSGPNKGEPRRQPKIWYYVNGIPKDWTNAKSLHALNTRRRDNLRDITRDPPWTIVERQYLSSLFDDFPDASIRELTERFNHRFVGDFRNAVDSPEAVVNQRLLEKRIKEGRTIESVRHEYLTWKKVYDAGEYPAPPRDETHKKPNPLLQPHIDSFERDWDPATDKEESGYPVGGFRARKAPSKNKVTRAAEAKEVRKAKAGTKVPKAPRAIKTKTPRKTKLSSAFVEGSDEEGAFETLPKPPHNVPEDLPNDLLVLASSKTHKDDLLVFTKTPNSPKAPESKLCIAKEGVLQFSGLDTSEDPEGGEITEARANSTPRSASCSHQTSWTVTNRKFEEHYPEFAASTVEELTQDTTTFPVTRAARSIIEESYSSADDSYDDQSDIHMGN
ncbi:hypothetical protein K504DRAFT_448018 [Pleomassaria siparia CBS 279.74]|uniref:Uncharacterized protein n=1 Tax=Pleomassaria siparia CBS 279.74 TaxID=1314801 RepID=A0A6G1K0C2_9PLEO|nr:hypothetical protein K504DRAFT_448018 [Pleomassaria siparia CBS 279.74]